MNPTQVNNLTTNLIAVHRFYKFARVYPIIVAMAGGEDAATLLNVILGKLAENVGSDSYVQLNKTDGATGARLGALLACGVRNCLIAGVPNCWIETEVFVARLAQVLGTGAVSARLLLQLPWDMDYTTYINHSPQWAARRWARMSKDGFMCQRCQAHGCALEVHHTTREAYTRLGRETDSDLLTVCLRCHDALHGRKRGQRKTVRQAVGG